MLRRVYFLFGVFAHVLFLGVFAYMAGFVGNFIVPKSIDAPAIVGGSIAVSVAVNLVLLALFAVPHSVMARPAFKRWWTQFVPKEVERTVYVFVSNALMLTLLALWRPIDTVIFDLQHPIARVAMWSLFACGWLLVPLASLMINHFDLFGTRQVWLNLQQKAYTALPFRTPWLYRFIRHPLYVGWITAFWATPTLTVGHALFAATLTAYMLIAIPIEERDLIAHYGDEYRSYRNRVGGLVPRVPAFRFDPTVLLDITWISWVVMIVLLSASFTLDRFVPVLAAFCLCMLLVWIDLARHSDIRAMSVQIRLGYGALLLVGLIPGMWWIHAVQLVGTSARVLTGYCLLDRELRLMPWNRSEPLTLADAWKVITATPGCGGIVRFTGGSEALDSGCRGAALAPAAA